MKKVQSKSVRSCVIYTTKGIVWMQMEEISIKGRLRSHSKTDMAGAGSSTKSSTPKNDQYKEDGKEKTSKEIWEMLTGLQSSMNTILQDVSAAKGIETRLKNVETLQTSNGGRVDKVEQSIAEQDLRIRIMTNIIIKQEEELTYVRNQLDEARRRDIRNNIIIAGVVEEVDETKDVCQEKVKSFFKDSMEITETIDIEAVKRLGPKKSKNRAILVRLKEVSDKSIIFSHVRNLKGKTNARKKLFYVNDDLDPEQAEEKRKYRELIKENKQLPDDKKIDSIKFVRNRIQVDQVIIKPKVFPPTATDVLRLTDEEREEIKTIKLVGAGEHSESGSDYAVFVQKVRNVEEVQKGLFKTRIRFGDATHVSCGYRLSEAYGPYNQEGLDDKEIGAGRTILETLKSKGLSNICVYVVRWYGGIRMGPRRFEVIKELTEGAITAYQYKARKRQTRRERSLSQTSLASISSLGSEMSIEVDAEHSEATPLDQGQERQEENREENASVNG